MLKREKRFADVGLLFVALFLLVAASGCDYLEKRRVRKTVENRAQALLKGDAKAYLAFFSPDYSDPWLSFDVIRENVKKRLQQKPLPIMSFGNREISLQGDKAMVIEKFTIEDKVEGTPKRYDETQRLILERTPDGWKCSRGSELLRLLSGRIEEEYNIEQVLLRREAALVKEDIRSYMSLVSPRYSHKGEGPEDLRAKVLQNFRVYDDIQFRSYDRKIWFFGDAATVQQKFNMHAVQMGKSMNFSGEERFELEKTDQGWKFTMGL